MSLCFFKSRGGCAFLQDVCMSQVFCGRVCVCATGCVFVLLLLHQVVVVCVCVEGFAAMFLGVWENMCVLAGCVSILVFLWFWW